MPQRVLEEHKALAEHFERLATTTELDGLDSALAGLLQTLPAHFAHEEETDGFFDQVLDRSPRYRDHVLRLIREHGELNELISRVHDRVVALRAALHGLGKRLQAHEAVEQELLMDSIYTDLGEGD